MPEAALQHTSTTPAPPPPPHLRSVPATGSVTFDHPDLRLRVPGTVTEPTLRQMIRPFWIFGALLMMLDGLTTYIALTHFAVDGAREGNPIGVWAIEHLGVAGMCAVKVLIGITMMWRLAAVADRGHRHKWMNRSVLLRPSPEWKVRRNAAWALAFSVTLMGIVVGNNLRAIISLAVG